MAKFWIAHHGDAIYGAGTTQRAALRDALRWTDSTDNLELLPATSAVYRALRRDGFDPQRFEFSGTVARLRRWDARAGIYR